MRTVILGVDGLTFRVLHPMIQRGELPNFRKLSEGGCEAILSSQYPPLTPPAWVSLSTGMKPAVHGVYDFWEYQEQEENATGGRKARVMTHRKGGKAIWNILSEYGKRVLVINVPMTYPPEPINGIMVSGYMTPSSEVDFTYPQSFREELFRVVPDYQIDLDHDEMDNMNITGQSEQLIDATLRMTVRRIDLTIHLLKEKPWDLCYVAFVGPDRLQHPLWQEISAMDTRATEYYRLLDKGLGLVLEQLEPEDQLFVVSDHGFQGINQTFAINEYLLRKGLLKLASNSKHIRAGRKQLKRWLKLLGLLTLARKAKAMFRDMGLVKETMGDVTKPLLTDLDWQRTEAYVPSLSGYPGSYVDIFFREDVSPGRVAEVAEDLKRQVNPRNGQKLVDAIYTKEAYGKGPFAPREPHLLVLPTEGITFRMDFSNKDLWEESSRVRGTHQKDGVLYAYGGGIKRGYKDSRAEVFDLVPTVLHGMGLPFPHSFDGHVLEDLFLERERVERPLAAASDENESGLARRKLKKLLDLPSNTSS